MSNFASHLYSIDLSETLQSAIETGNWTDEAIEQLNNILNNETDRKKILFKRFPQGMDSEIQGVLGQAEAIVSSRGNSTDEENFKPEILIEAFAKNEGLWFNDYTNSKAQPYSSLEEMLSSEYQQSDSGGSEADVYYREREVIKSINASHYNVAR